MDWFSYIVAGILVYVAVVVFIGGSIFQIVKWRRSCKTSIKQGIFPKPRGTMRFLKLGWDSLVFPWVIDTDAWMWFFVIGMHIAGIGLFFGHLRLFGDPGFLLSTVGEGTLNNLGGSVGAAIGIFLFVAFMYFLIRRMKYPYKELSVPADYLLLLLVLLLILLGDHLRLTHAFEIDSYRTYMASLVAFRPEYPTAIEFSPDRWVLTFHVFTANLLLLYFPFSKLVHSLGGWATNLMRSE